MFERFSAKGVQFLLGIILARLLLPEDYGLIGIVFIFIAISTTITDSGFKSALIQKKNRDEKDFSTVFYFNIIAAVLFYCIIFFTAPLIATFFNNQELISLIRVSMVSIIINSFSVVQIAKYSIDLDFKTQTKATLISILISGSVGIILAYNGFGVWSLVTQFIIRNSINVTLLCFYSKWIPVDGFHRDRFISLFSFGSKLLISSLLQSIYRNIYIIIIAKFFPIKELGFYTRARQFSDFPSSNLTQILDRVTFPILSQLQDDKQKLTEKYKLLIGNSSLVFFPLMILLLSLSEPLIILILTEKWLSLVWMLQLLCLASILYPIHSLNLNILKVKGRSDLFLKLEVLKKIITTIIVIISIPLGIKGLLIGNILVSLIALFLNTYYTQKFIDYSLFSQFKDIITVLFFNVIMGLIVLFTISFFENNLFKIIVGSSSGLLFYVSATWFFDVGHIKQIPKYFN
jgi:O-antigen/teichoic acid export membrane protein